MEDNKTKEEHYGDVCGICGGIIHVDGFGMYCPKCQPHRDHKSTKVNEWLKVVDKDLYEKASVIQMAIPEFRAMGTYGKMLIAQFLEYSQQSTKHLQDRIVELRRREAILTNLIVAEWDNDFEKYPLPICFDPGEEQRELNRRSQQIERDIKELLNTKS